MTLARHTRIGSDQIKDRQEFAVRPVPLGRLPGNFFLPVQVLPRLFRRLFLEELKQPETRAENRTRELRGTLVTDIA